MRIRRSSPDSVDAGRAAGHHESRAGAHHRGAGLLGQPPLPAEVGVRRVAVDRHDRAADQEGGHERVPHHPGGRGVPEQGVAGAEVPRQGVVLQVLQQRSRRGRARSPSACPVVPGGEQHDERVVEGHGHGLGRALGAPRRAAPRQDRRVGDPPARRTRCRGRAARSAAPARICVDLGPHGRCPWRRSGSRRRPGAPPARPARSGRSRCGRRTRSRSWSTRRRARPRPGTRPAPRGCSGR